MAREKFQDFRFRADTLAIIDRAQTIIATYEAQGYRLTLRQLYYQFIARDAFRNTEANYKRLGSIINDARLAGLIDWSAIEDRTRNLRGVGHWEDPSEIIDAVAAQFRIDKWSNQHNRVEVWVEKDALVGVIERVCTRYDVNYFACRGYVSQSEMYDASKRIASYLGANQEVTIIHLGDHDPSGIDMTRDIRERLEMFLRDDAWLLNVNRIALNYPQIEQYSPPPNPAKTTDSRFEKYLDEYGDESWELDALEPRVISELIQGEVLALRDEALWAEKIEEENEHRRLLGEASERWSEVVEMLEG